MYVARWLVIVISGMAACEATGRLPASIADFFLSPKALP
jgi:hypothetical protein